MRTLALLVAVLAALVWSAVVWGGYVLLGATGVFVAQNAGMFGLPPDLVAWAHYLFENFGQGTAVVLWLLGLGLVGIVWLIFSAVAGRVAPARQQVEDHRAPRAAEAAAPSRSAPGAPAWGRDASRR